MCQYIFVLIPVYIVTIWLSQPKEKIMGFVNAYEDPNFADAYSALEFPGTYFLAFRDLPEIVSEHVQGEKALDFGCGAGRSTRFLQSIGFDAIGIDISGVMINKAYEIDPRGDYRLIENEGFDALAKGHFDLILSAFTFDNVPTAEKKIELFTGLGKLLSRRGRMINLVSSPDIYYHEWASFSTRDYPENKKAKPGDIVKIVNTSVRDSRPVDDIIWPDKNYLDVYKWAGFEAVQTYKPLAQKTDPGEWINETKIAPWVIYVLKTNR
jgi:SAM-dependent methyltransferase